MPTTLDSSYSFTMLPDWLMEYKGLSLGAKVVYARLNRYTNMKEGKAFPKISTLSAELNISPRTIERHLVELSKAELITIVLHREQCAPSEYILHDPPWMPKPDGTSFFNRQIGVSPHAKMSGEKETDYKDKNNKHMSENLFENQKSVVEGDTPLPNRFEEFWESYPRKTCKCNARKAWDKIISKKYSYNVQDYILNSLENHKKSKNHLLREEQFIPHPATWLNQERWLDEVQTEMEVFCL